MDAQEVDDLEYMMEDMTILPAVACLRLIVMAKGHAFGACSFHVLRICSGVQRLVLDLFDFFKFEVKLIILYNSQVTREIWKGMRLCLHT